MSAPPKRRLEEWEKGIQRIPSLFFVSFCSINRRRKERKNERKPLAAAAAAAAAQKVSFLPTQHSTAQRCTAAMPSYEGGVNKINEWDLTSERERKN